MSNSIHINRRKFLQMGASGIGLFAAGGLANCSGDVSANSSAPFYKLKDIGPLQAPDEHGLMLPAGFSYRIVARSGEAPVGLPGYTWHGSPDGGACFPTEDGGWVYVSNSEMRSNAGGVGALRFNAQGEKVAAYSILKNTSINCAGGATPWGTWLSCEEFTRGQVYECDPMGNTTAVVRPALGTFRHEAVAVDSSNQCLYLTEDEPDGGFYRFATTNGLPDLTVGRLEIAALSERDGQSLVNWLPVPDPLASQIPTRRQVLESAQFRGGEGIALHAGKAFFVTKHDNRVWCYDTENQHIEVVYDVSSSDNPILSGVDNVVITPGGDVLVAEDGGDMQLVAITADGELMPLLQIIGQQRSEIVGPAFDPSYQRLYFSSQRGSTGNRRTGGITYEISYTG
ncbi:MAG: DUF839 domain-containing protein [Gammaproteobacteria bacterium]|nr:DUF839 domain-containing protein [Gammaproteobacteria bacterium]